MTVVVRCGCGRLGLVDRRDGDAEIPLPPGWERRPAESGTMVVPAHEPLARAFASRLDRPRIMCDRCLQGG